MSPAIRDCGLTALPDPTRNQSAMVVLAAIAALLSGCAWTPASLPLAKDPPGPGGVVGMLQFEPGAASDISRIALASHESFLMPLGDVSNNLPSYPESRLSETLPPREVCLRFAVGVEGRVSAVVDVTDHAGCGATAPAEPDFVAAATHAVNGWRFEPAIRCVFPDASARRAAANTGCAGAQEIPEAVSLHYRFVFEQQDGRGAVRLGADSPGVRP